MLKFIKHNMDTISGIEIYPIIALLIFFLFFVGLIVWVFTYKKHTLNELSNLPLQNTGNNESSINTNTKL
ncbi:CcoQ/FixQ family Cbb3-type cytochrome c oxidase assembly chaperone [Flavobacterium sp. CBA20B-1]|uniref:CcoQ/FixQ family Cbb3-type cytochrome c oxidase assembly chaperone n=1 Tax=Paenimyroides aestuarii TaxID=2968490 RepID=A0ABY5NS59_9FLAO|nr:MULTISPECIES: CcoQ/FixQ family Cbb3-type cytochrome c oxidase assembly chaperone [Flavobacteriaceae]UUV21414.1 CcoQ/FixQ family Cbb3-type cytochrome c oxidase assembly chaperone [Paenimyroides aestuarii]WCM42156.1 CcoQ/FixQ family Cbb3-type cytochrome c oxidase assembly chaperone [Flavobacterium sp. CBA20B-1]